MPRVMIAAEERGRMSTADQDQVSEPADSASRAPESDDLEPTDQPTEPVIADVFGDVLPEVTSDERGTESDWRDREDHDRDDWLRGEVPPHH